MKFNPKSRLDTKQIRDRRGRATSGGGGLPSLRTGGGGLSSGLPVGGGIVGVIIALVIAFVVWKSGGGEPSGSASTAAGTSSDSDIVERCQTGADANKYEDCAIVADVNSIQSYWNKALPQQTGTTYSEVPTTWFTGSTSTGCGNATSAVGPFYCPADKVVYIDLTFFHDMLQGQLGARGGPFRSVPPSLHPQAGTGCVRAPKRRHPPRRPPPRGFASRSGLGVDRPARLATRATGSPAQ
jgi:predicted metalloprotease